MNKMEKNVSDAKTGRIEEACLQLAATDDSITEIAYRNGFNDLSYFIRTFKKYKGMTPGKYKRR